MHRFRTAAPRLGWAAAAVLTLVVGACSGSDGATEPTTIEDEGERLAAESGCVACHGDEGEGGVGPPWVDLAGSTVELTDGSTLIADNSYLRRAITDPEADLVSGYTVLMPSTPLTSTEADAIVAYIESLSSIEEPA